MAKGWWDLDSVGVRMLNTGQGLLDLGFTDFYRALDIAAMGEHTWEHRALDESWGGEFRSVDLVSGFRDGQKRLTS